MKSWIATVSSFYHPFFVLQGFEQLWWPSFQNHSFALPGFCLIFHFHQAGSFASISNRHAQNPQAHDGKILQVFTRRYRQLSSRNYSRHLITYSWNCFQEIYVQVHIRAPHQHGRQQRPQLCPAPTQFSKLNENASIRDAFGKNTT